MPFKVDTFKENIEGNVDEAAGDELRQACDAYTAMTTPRQKACAIREIMEILDRETSANVRHEIMEACGRQCIGASVLDKARCLQKESENIDDLIIRLNQVHIGGGNLSREGNVIHAFYDRCYCGSVSQSKKLLSGTYCHCSCGWYRQLFETLLSKPVEIELQGSILQGAERCEFLISVQAKDGAWMS